MGILNVTPDSFFDAGRCYNPQMAVDRAIQMLEEGADIIDIGGESTRPGADSISQEEELDRILPVLEQLRSITQCAISIDTSKAEVARQSLQLGADIINDVTALSKDEAMVDVIKDSDCGVILMHMQGQPATMQLQPVYEDVVNEVLVFLEERRIFLTSQGVNLNRICLDPGIGFGKTFEHNQELLRHVESFTSLETPFLLGISRKSFLGIATGEPKLADRLWPTVAMTSYARECGVDIFRVHDVRENAKALRMTERLMKYDHLIF